MPAPLATVEQAMTEHLFPLLEAVGLDENQRALVADLVGLCQTANAEHHAPGELGEAMVLADRVRARVEGVAAVATHRFGASTDWALARARSAPGWLAVNTGVGRGHAAALLRRSNDLAACPHVLAGAQAGQLTTDKVRLLLSVRTQALAEAFAAQEQVLAETVAGLTVAGAAVYLQAWVLEAKERLGVDDPDDRFKEHHDTNWFRLRSLLDGRHVADGEFDAEGTAVLQESLDGLVRTWQRDGSLEGDTRSLPELYAAALLDLVGRGAGHATPNRPSALVLIDHDTLVKRSGEGPLMPFRSEILGGGAVDPEVLRRMCCNADITRVVMDGRSEVLDVGRTQRLAPPAIRVAVWARSGGWCEVCHQVKLTWCQVHHIIPWDPTAGNGPTSVENSALVCNHCHRLLHEGRHTLRRSPDGFLLVRPDGHVVTTRLRHRPRPPGTDPPPGDGAPPGRGLP